MAADVIQAQYESLETIAVRFGRQAEASRSIETSVARSLRSLQSGGWEGRGAAAFFDEMTGSVLPALARLAQALQQAQTVTLQIKAVLRAAEEEAAQPFHSPAEAAAPAQEASGSWWDGAKEWLHGALDVAGLIPGLGEIADGANALIYLAEGRFVEAGISAVAMIPILGDVGKAGKWGVKAGKELLEEGAERAAKEGAETLVERTAKEGAETAVEKAAKESADEVLQFGKLAPNTTYIRNGYEYSTDELGRVSRVNGDLRLEPGIRTPHQTEVGNMGLSTDEGGHLIATRFDGIAEGVNLVPQDANLNRGAWKRMENEWARALHADHKVSVDIHVRYLPGESKRPSAFVVEYEIEGNIVKRIFRNRPGG